MGAFSLIVVINLVNRLNVIVFIYRNFTKLKLKVKFGVKKMGRRRRSASIETDNGKGPRNPKTQKHSLVEEESPSIDCIDSSEKVAAMLKYSLTFSDFDKLAIDLAKYLLGKLVVRVLDSGKDLTGRIVETEAYPGKTDVASHSYRGQTERNKAMFMSAGACYVYYIYGRQNCVNVSSKDEAGAVLIRALEPIEGHAQLLRNRTIVKSTRDAITLKTVKYVSNGPAKLCQAFNITKDEFNCKPLNIDALSQDSYEDSPIKTVSEISSDIPKLFFMKSCDREIDSSEIITSNRVGIDGCGKEAAALPFRFYVRNNFYVSVFKNTDI